METYRTTIKKRMARYIVFAVLSLALVAALTVYTFVVDPDSREPMSDFMHGFVRGGQTGLLACLIVFLVVDIARCARALKDPEKLKQMYVKETDERNNLVSAKADQATFKLTLYLVALAGVLACFFSSTVALTLFCVLAFIIVARGVSRGHFERTL